MIDNNSSELDAFSLVHSRLQSKLLQLHLQLAEASDGKPKRSGNFETTYESEGGQTITVQRSPDGKFASKGGGGSSAGSESKPPEPAGGAGSRMLDATLDYFNNRGAIPLVKGLSEIARDLPDIKAGIEKASFKEILGGAGDAISSAEKYINKKLSEASEAASKQIRDVAIGKMLVAGVAIAVISGASALVGGASVSSATGIAVGFGMATLVTGGSTLLSRVPDKVVYEKFKKVQEQIPSIEGFKEGLDRMIKESTARNKEVKQLLSDIETVVETKKTTSNPEPKVEPKADAAVKAAAVGPAGNALKSGLASGAAENPNVAAGIDATKMTDVAVGDKDFFANATKFLEEKMMAAKEAVSEKTKDMAIGGAIVGAMTAAFAMGKEMGTEAGKIVRDRVNSILEGTDIDERIKEKLENLTPESVGASLAEGRAFLENKENREKMVSDLKQTIEDSISKLKSGEVAGQISEATKDLDTRVKEMRNRMQRAIESLQRRESLQRATDAPDSDSAIA